MKYFRHVSPIEKPYLAKDLDKSTPCAFHFVIEGTGELCLSKLQDAVDQCVLANPGSNLILKGHMRFARWHCHNVIPRVRTVKAAHWDGYSDEGAPFLTEPLDARQGPNFEVLIAEGSPNRLIFRAHHGVTDGQGFFMLIRDILFALENKLVQGSDSAIRDIDVMRRTNSPPIQLGKMDAVLPTGTAQGEDLTFRWKRFEIPAKQSLFLPRLSQAILQSSLRYFDDPLLRFRITVDLRRALTAERSTANLSGGFDLEVNKSSSLEDLQHSIDQQLASNQAFAMPPSILTKIGEWMPIHGFRPSNNNTLKYLSKPFRVRSATLSNVGTFNLSEIKIPGFKAENIFFIPPLTVTKPPIFVVAVRSEEKTNIVISGPTLITNNNRLDILCEDIKGYFEECIQEEGLDKKIA